MQLRHCPTCGAALAPAPGPHRPQTCAGCGTSHFHNAKPCAGVLVTRAGRVLLGRRRFEPRRGEWDIPGGFLREDEHPEEGARREILEETGLELGALRLFGFYMDRYGHGAEAPWILNIYYEGESRSGIEPRPADDVLELAWFAPADLPSTMAFPHEDRVLAEWRAHMRI